MMTGASSDKEAVVKIMRHLADGYVLVRMDFCSAERCPVPVHMEFQRR